MTDYGGVKYHKSGMDKFYSPGAFIYCTDRSLHNWIKNDNDTGRYQH